MYILILLFHPGYGYTNNPQVIEFNSHTACEAAAEEINDWDDSTNAIEPTWGTPGRSKAIRGSVCLYKGDLPVEVVK